MRLLHAKTLTFEDFLGSNIPVYAIVSHRWGETELSYQSFLRDKEQYVRGHLESYGWAKIVKAAELALQWGLQWVWLDMICINKESSAELTEAINSMYDWYRYASTCFVFLPDVEYDEAWDREESSTLAFTAEVDTTILPAVDHRWAHDRPGLRILQPIVHKPVPMYEQEFIESTWFGRSWTLQELLAPGSVVFFNSKFQSIGTRNTLAPLIKKATKIPLKFLEDSNGSRPLVTEACVAERMRWASHRDATRTEDKAYSMLGLFQVNLPLLYGEGNRAFRRLQIEILKETHDESLLAWMSELALIPGLPSTANSPVLSRSTNMFLHARAAVCPFIQRKHYEVTNMGLRFTLPVSPSSENTFSSLAVFDLDNLMRYGASSSLLFPLNCIGACKGVDGKIITGRLALLIVLDKQRSHAQLKNLVGARSRQLLISPDLISEDTCEADADVPMPVTRVLPGNIAKGGWISVATGEPQSFDLFVDYVGTIAAHEYSLYLKL